MILDHSTWSDRGLGTGVLGSFAFDITPCTVYSVVLEKVRWINETYSGNITAERVYRVAIDKGSGFKQTRENGLGVEEGEHLWQSSHCEDWVG